MGSRTSFGNAMALVVQDRDREFLDHVARYRMITREAVKKLLGLDDDATKGLLKRLSALLQAHQLYRTTKYYMLTAEQARKMGVPEEATEPFGPQALPIAFGVLSFCCMGPVIRHRYTRPDLLREFPELESLCRDKYYLRYFLDEDGEQTRFGVIHVDLGGAYERIVRTLRTLIREGLQKDGLKDIIDDGLLTIAVVTPAETKRRAIELVLQGEDLAGARLIIHVEPKLQNLLGRGVDEKAPE